MVSLGVMSSFVCLCVSWVGGGGGLLLSFAYFLVISFCAVRKRNSENGLVLQLPDRKSCFKESWSFFESRMIFTVGGGDVKIPPPSLCRSCRQCALVALQDVKSYLTEEGGQIAVSLCFSFQITPLHEGMFRFYKQIPLFCVFRFLTQQTQQENAEI